MYVYLKSTGNSTLNLVLDYMYLYTSCIFLFELNIVTKQTVLKKLSKHAIYALFFKVDHK